MSSKQDVYETQEWKDSYKQALFMILCKYVPSFLEKGLISPPEVKLENEKYRVENEKYRAKQKK